MSLTSLYPELVLDICKYLHRSECAQLRLTCKALAHTVAGVVMHMLYIDSRTKDHMDLLHVLSGRSVMSAPTHAIISLKIGRIKQIDGCSSADVAEYDSMIYEAFSKLVNVTNVYWFISAADTPLSSIIGPIISSYPRLRSLSVVVTHCHSVPALRLFRNLIYISFSSSVEGSNVDWTLGEIGQAIAQSPNLRNLTLGPKPLINGDWDQRLEAAGAFTSRHRIKDIKFQLRYPPFSLVPYFQHLQTLTLIQVHEESPTSARTSLEAFWKLMKEHRVKLEKITIDHIPHSFIHYLKHFEGLRALRIPLSRHYRDYTILKSDEFAREFYDEALICHAKTIEVLAIRIDHEDGWCWTPAVQKRLDKCVELRFLRIGITHKQLEASVPALDGEGSGSTDSRLVLHDLIDRMAQCRSVRNLELVTTGPLDYNVERHYRMNEEMWHMMRRSMTAYRPPLDVNTLPAICGIRTCPADHQCFTPKWDENGTKLRYDLLSR